MFAVARAEQRARDAVYRTYVTESLRGIPQGKYLTRSLQDALTPRPEIDADAVITHVQAALEA